MIYPALTESLIYPPNEIKLLTEGVKLLLAHRAGWPLTCTGTVNSNGADTGKTSPEVLWPPRSTPPAHRAVPYLRT